MKKIITLISLILIISFTATGCDDITATFIQDNYVTAQPKDAALYDVVRVVDGDTIVVGIDDENKKVRLIGIDAHESVHSDKSKNCKFGKTASEYAKQLLENKNVSLEYDEEMYDRYGRILAYVYLGDEMVNYDLVVKGFAVAKEYKPNTKYADIFARAQIEAEKSKAGMWSDNVSNSDCNLKEEYYISY